MTISKRPGRRGPDSPTLRYEDIGEAGEVARQILTDVRAFGLKLPESITQGSIKLGYGDGVCFIINDLLNRELIRLDFRFKTPVPQSETQAGGNDESYDEIDCSFDEALIMRAEPEEPLLPEPDELEDTAILLPTVLPEDWEREYQRYKNKLGYSKEDLRLAETDWQSRLVQTIGHLKVVREMCSEANMKGWARMVGEWGDELTRINKCEKRLQELCKEDIVELTQILTLKREIANKLHRVRNHVAQQCEEFDQIKEREGYLARKIENATNRFSDSSPLNEIKAAVRVLKEEVSKLKLGESLAIHMHDRSLLKPDVI